MHEFPWTKHDRLLVPNNGAARWRALAGGHSAKHNAEIPILCWAMHLACFWGSCLRLLIRLSPGNEQQRFPWRSSIRAVGIVCPST